jgi:hypothetical protein
MKDGLTNGVLKISGKRWCKMLQIANCYINEMHDLIVDINIQSTKLEKDIRNLNNLFHYVKGDGFRLPEFKKLGDTGYKYRNDKGV